MITLETLCVRVSRVTPQEVEAWVERAWIRPEGARGHYLFQPIDEARVRLILELRDEMGVAEESLPVVLSLLDQLYTARRQMQRVAEVIARHEGGAREELGRLLREG